MAAGLGFKTFAVGEVLSAANVNGYLMQGVLVFANATARDAAITSPQEGQFAFTKDNDSLWYYSGSAWVSSGATGDIEGVTAGVGISGGGTSGTVTVTNSMATAIDAKGDLIGGTGADTFARLAVGANDTVLTADSSTATGLKWAAPAGGGGMTLINTGGTTLSGSSTTISSIPGTYKNLQLIVRAPKPSSNGVIQIRFNGDSSAKYWRDFNASSATPSDTVFNISASQDSGTNNGLIAVDIFDYTTTTWKMASIVSLTNASSTTINTMTSTGVYIGTSAISSLTIYPQGTWTSGTAYLYGVA
jgi:hypothetical protein